jgi:hypothetical protein
MEAEDHILSTINAIPVDRLPELTAQLLQRLVALDGSYVVREMFPSVAAHWVEPPSYWRPHG